MADYYDYDRLTIPATAGAEFLAAAIGYKKNIEVKRKKGEKYDYYKREAERADRYADALRLAEQIASGELDNGAALIGKRAKTYNCLFYYYKKSDNKEKKQNDIYA